MANEDVLARLFEELKVQQPQDVTRYAAANADLTRITRDGSENGYTFKGGRLDFLKAELTEWRAPNRAFAAGIISGVMDYEDLPADFLPPMFRALENELSEHQHEPAREGISVALLTVFKKASEKAALQDEAIRQVLPVLDHDRQSVRGLAALVLYNSAKHAPLPPAATERLKASSKDPFEVVRFFSANALLASEGNRPMREQDNAAIFAADLYLRTLPPFPKDGNVRRQRPSRPTILNN